MSSQRLGCLPEKRQAAKLPPRKERSVRRGKPGFPQADVGLDREEKVIFISKEKKRKGRRDLRLAEGGGTIR